MALSSSNTYITPTASKSLGLSRVDWNNSLRAVLRNFHSDAAPTSDNFSLEGAFSDPPRGTLYFSSRTGAFYVRNLAGIENPLYGNEWTRSGIGYRVETTIGGVDISTYEVGEPFIVPSSSNTRMLVKSDTTGNIQDIGLPHSRSIQSGMLKENSVDATAIGSGVITNDHFASGAIGGVNRDWDADRYQRLDGTHNAGTLSSYAGSVYNMEAGKICQITADTNGTINAPSSGYGVGVLHIYNSSTRSLTLSGFSSTALNEESLAGVSGSIDILVVERSSVAGSDRINHWIYNRS